MLGSRAFARFECLFCLRHRRSHRLRWLITQSFKFQVHIFWRGPWKPYLDPIKTATTSQTVTVMKEQPRNTYYVKNPKQSTKCREFLALRTVFSFLLSFRSAEVCQILSVKFMIKWNFNLMFAPCQSFINGIRNHRVCLADWLTDSHFHQSSRAIYFYLLLHRIAIRAISKDHYIRFTLVWRCTHATDATPFINNTKILINDKIALKCW